MIKVNRVTDSYQTATYRVGNGRKDFTFRELTGKLYTEHKYDSLEEAEKAVASAWVAEAREAQSSEDIEKEEAAAVRAVTKLCKYCPPLSRRLSEEAVALLKQYIGYFADSNGNYQWFHRLSNPGRVWDTCSNPIPAMSDKDKGRFKTFQREWYNLHSLGKIKAWTAFDIPTGELSPLMNDAELLDRVINSIPDEDSLEISAKARAWFIQWAEDNFDPKLKPWGDVARSPVDLLPNLRSIFEPNSIQGWAAGLMKDEDSLQISMPETITNNPEVDAFTYVNISELRDGPTPAWDKWIQSVHPVCREIFMAAVFAPMHEKCRHRKLVWMRSQGYDGKSTFFNALNRWSGGKLTQSFSSHNLSSDFGLEQLVGARILLWGDSQHEHALSTNVVHNITGGDLVSVNRKHEKAFQYRFNAMLFVASNSRPQLKSWARNETTRLLYIPFIEPKEEVLKEFAQVDENGNVLRHSDGTPMFKGSNLEEELLAEMPHILYKCGIAYKKHCPPPFRDIVVPKEVYDLMLEENEHEDGHEFASFVANNLAIGEEFQVPVKEVHDKFKRIVKTSNRQTLSELFRYLERNYKIQKKKIGGRNSQQMHYIGCKLSMGGSQQSTMFDKED